jgi:hypothetical protein
MKLTIYFYNILEAFCFKEDNNFHLSGTFPLSSAWNYNVNNVPVITPLVIKGKKFADINIYISRYFDTRRGTYQELYKTYKLPQK